MSRLRTEIEKVVRRDNCSGCGACELLSPQITVELDASGYMRPRWRDEPGASGAGFREDRDRAETFRRMCPGVRVEAPAAPGAASHPVLGSYVSAWSGFALDPAVRHAGSSGGVLTALSAWLLRTGQTTAILSAAPDAKDASRTVPARLTDHGAALSSAGSRYAPVAIASRYASQDPTEVVVGKPCEISAIRQLRPTLPVVSPAPQPLLSFFCAGTPSQPTTDRLVERLGHDTGDVEELWYRGRGWPGEFTVVSTSGQTDTMSYDQSWGQHLGRSLQGRCKICPDGTGMSADIVVGDYWQSDDRGYPMFTDSPGVSVVIARTALGHELLLQARGAGVIALEAVELDDVLRVQPLQVDRMRSLAGRLFGRLAALKPGPRYHGFGLARLAMRNPVGSARAAVGSWVRAVPRHDRGRGR